jgi:putative methylase
MLQKTRHGIRHGQNKTIFKLGSNPDFMQITKSGLAIILSKLRAFDAPSFIDEQYTTDSEIAATVLWNAFMSGNIRGKTIADLGAGTGFLGIGAGLLGARLVFFVEKDAKAIEILKCNLAETRKKMEKCVTKIICDDIKNFRTGVDVVFQNPPFGVKKEHADRIFLEKAFEISSLVYSFHKSESTAFLQGFAARHGFTIAGEQRFSFPLRQTMKYHRSRIRRIGVSCYEFIRT